jgi:hypothetical protein
LPHSLQHTVPSSKSDACNPKKTNSKVPSIAIWLPILWIPACMNRPLNPWLAVSAATNYRWIGIRKTPRNGLLEAKTVWDHQPKPSQLGNPRGKSSKSLMFQAQFWAKQTAETSGSFVLRGSSWKARQKTSEPRSLSLGERMEKDCLKPGATDKPQGCLDFYPTISGIHRGYWPNIDIMGIYWGYRLEHIPWSISIFWWSGRD